MISSGTKLTRWINTGKGDLCGKFAISRRPCERRGP
jgi:hypothetical protein